jgi:uncharacterized protein YacL
MRARSSILFGLCIFGAIVFGLIGWSLGSFVPLSWFPAPFDNLAFARSALVIILGLVGVLLFPLILGPLMTRLVNWMESITATQIVADFIGLSGGLLLAVFLAFPLARLPEPFGQVLPFLVAVAFGSFGLGIMNMRYRELFKILNIRLPGLDDEEAEPGQPKAKLLLDTSVIIDGRIADVAATGFIRGDLVVPHFVLSELQYVADSPDGMRRARGRRGLEVLKRLQIESLAPVHIVNEDIPESTQVDEKLILLAKKTACPIMTNDYNLNKVASLQGVHVLNINELANAVKTVLLPGENLQVRVIQGGKERGQGVGYLEDGTMVVVEDGENHLNKTIPVTVTKILQTAAGRMIFAKP